MKVEELGVPCRVFSFMSAEYIPQDPKDGKEKYVMGTQCAHTHSAHIVIFDPDSLATESIETPGDINIWALLYLPEYERLVVGTSGFYGWVHCLDMRTRTWMESLRLESETYIWNFTRGGDGLVYGGNYPGCSLCCYDPKRHTLTGTGRAGNHPDNMYVRAVRTLPDGNILVSVGECQYETHLYDIKSGQFRQVFSQGEFAEVVTDNVIVTSFNKGELRFYDVNTLELLEGPIAPEQVAPERAHHPAVVDYLTNDLNNKYAHLLPYNQDCHMKTLKDGRVIGYFKQQVIIIENGAITFHDVKATPPAVMIHALSVDDTGIVWFSSADGQAMGYYNPKTGEVWNSNAVTPKAGQIYGIVPLNGCIYLTAYVGGDHVVYDPRKPWNQFENVNPKTLRSVAPQKMGRPIAGSILGPDGNIWTGWCGIYSVYGGGISRIDAETNEVTGWFGLVPEQSIGHITAGKNHIYATSHWMNSGLPYRFDEPFCLLRLDMDCNIVWREQFQIGQFPECLTVIGKRLFMTMRDRLDGKAKLFVYDEDTMKKITVKEMGTLGALKKGGIEENAIRALLPYGYDRLVAFIDDRACLIDAITLEILQTAQLPGIMGTCAIGKDKTIYFSIDEKLYSILFD